ncbi:MAG: hypothetical protein LBV16_06980 [Elusimicrobiota bacterium]|jgi:hypothetical protein|nr:hypothetical protein [Elusimicrobiota bacterium]
MNKNLAQIRNNVGIMLSKGAPEEDIDGYLASVGSNADEIKNYKDPGIVSAGLFANAAEGATVGLADVLYGAGGASLKKFKDAVSGNDNSPKITRGLSGFTLINDGDNKLRQATKEEDDANKASWSNLFNEYRKDFNDTKNQYNDYHGAIGTVADVAGSFAPIILTGGAGALVKGGATAGKAGLGQLAKQGFKTGGKWGGAYGAGNGLTEGDELSIGNALLGGATGLGMGAAGGALLPVLGSFAGKAIKPFTKQGKFDRFAKKIGMDKIDESIENNRPLIENADENIMSMAEGAGLNNVGARQILHDYANIRKGQQVGIIDDQINNTFGAKGADAVTREIEEAGKREYQMLYDKALNQPHGVIPNLEPTLKNPRIAKALKVVRKEYPEYDQFPDTHIQVLDLVKQQLDDDIAKAVNFNEKLKAGFLLEAKDNLVAKLDKASPIYKEARGSFAGMKDLQSFVDKGRNYNKMTREEIEELSKTLTPENKKAFNAGIRETLIKNLDDGAKSEGVNVARRVFDDSTLRKLEGLGIDDFQQLKDIMLKERQTMQNINRFASGSQTAEREADKQFRQALPVKMIFNPIRTAKKLTEKAYLKALGLGDEEIARYLTNTGALAKARSGGTSSRVNINPVFTKGYSATQLKDKAIKNEIRDKYADWYKNNLQGEKYQKEGLESDIDFNRFGKNEPQSNSAYINKLDFGKYAKELIDTGKLSGQKKLKHPSERYKYFKNIYTPVEYNGKKMKSSIFLGKNKFDSGYTYHDFSPMDYSVIGDYLYNRPADNKLNDITKLLGSFAGIKQDLVSNPIRKLLGSYEYLLRKK